MHIRSLVSAACAIAASAAYCGGSPADNAVANLYKINEGQGTLSRSLPGLGKAYISGQPGFEFWTVHLYGNKSYDYGYAMGSIMKPEIQAFVSNLWAYLESQAAGGIPGLPTWLADIIVNVGLDVALDLLIEITKPFTGDYVYEEMQGIADAADVDVKTLNRVHLFGELTEGDCTMIGSWGKATANGNLVQLRALDWDVDGPFKDVPAVVVYHVDSQAHPELGHSFANVGFLGWVGSLTGVSSAGLGINEIGVSFPDDTFGNESFTGIPFVFLLRDILQFDNDLQSALNRIQSAQRTCNLILGVGSEKDGVVRGVQYSASVANVYGDGATQLPVNSTWHPQFDNIVYNAMDWLCPGYDIVASTQLGYGYGQLTAELLLQNVTSITQTGDLHIAAYDLTANNLYVSFMASSNSTVQNPLFAYDRQPTKLSLTELWAEPMPV